VNFSLLLENHAPTYWPDVLNLSCVTTLGFKLDIRAAVYIFGSLKKCDRNNMTQWISEYVWLLFVSNS
jgi:hypothetical protein